MEDRIDRWVREGDRYATLAEHAANRVFVVLSLGFVASGSVVAAAIAARSAVILGFAPLVALMTVAVIVATTVESLYASIHQHHADLRVRKLLPEDLAIRPYGRGPLLPRGIAVLNIAVWLLVLGTFAVLVITLNAAAWVLDAGGWKADRTSGGDDVLIVATILLIAGAAALVAGFVPAWVSLSRLQRSFR